MRRVFGCSTGGGTGAAELGDRRARQRVGALVHWVPGMAAHPMPAHLVGAERGVKPLPEIDILDRLFVCRAPTVALPLGDPRHDTVAQILTVGVNIDPARPL